MSQVTLPYPLQDLIDVALGSQTRGNDDAIVAVLNGAVDNSNFLSGADAAGLGLTSDKIANLAITAAKLSVNAVTNTKILDGEVYGIKVADDDVGSEGQGGNRSELFSESDQVALTPVVGTRKQHGGKTIWAYFTLTSTTRAIIDTAADSIDWRYRMVNVQGFGFMSAVSKSYLPGGAQEDAARGTIWTGDPPVVTQYYNAAHFWSGAGSADGEAAPRGTMILDPVNTTTIYFTADTSGNLTVKADSLALAAIDVLVKIDVSPYIGAGP